MFQVVAEPFSVHDSSAESEVTLSVIKSDGSGQDGGWSIVTSSK